MSCIIIESFFFSQTGAYSKMPPPAVDVKETPFIQYNEASCITTSQVMEAGIKWSIQNFGFKCLSKKPGYGLVSINFHAPGDDKINWHLKLFPNGEEEEEKGKISVFLYPPVDVKSDLPTSISFSLLDKTSKKVFQTCKLFKNFTPNSTGYGFDIPNDDFLSVKTLLVCCKLEYESEDQLKTLNLPYDSSSQAANLNSDLAKLFTSMANSDVIFIVDKKEFPAHKTILAARSPVFSAMFQHDMKEAALNRVDIVDIEPDIFQALLRFIYTDQVDFTMENSTALLVASDRYHLDLLKSKCEAFLAQGLSIENCSVLLVLADVHDATNLKKAAVNFFRNFSSEVVATDEWKEMKKARPVLACEVL